LTEGFVHSQVAPVPTLTVVSESPTGWVVSITWSERLGWPGLGWGGMRCEGCSMMAFDCDAPHLECNLVYEATIQFDELHATFFVVADVTQDQAGNRNGASNTLTRDFRGHRALDMAVDDIPVEWGGTVCLSPAEVTQSSAFCPVRFCRDRFSPLELASWDTAGSGARRVRIQVH
jgi:hypothetical protein